MILYRRSVVYTNMEDEEEEEEYIEERRKHTYGIKG